MSTSELFCLHASTAEDVAQLRTRVELLRHISHPNVVEPIAFTVHDPSSATLQFNEVEALPLARISPSLSELLHISTQLASTVAYLHSRDVTHRQLSVDNVLVASSGHVIIAGFEQATFGLDHADDDVAAIGAIVQALARPSVEGIRGRLQAETTSASASAARSDLRDELLALATRVQSPDSANHLSALELATALRELANPNPVKVDKPARRHARSARSARTARPRRSLLRPVIVAAAATCTVLGGFAATQILSSTSPSPSLSPVEAEDEASPSLVASDAISIDSNVITINGERYTVGTSKDIIAADRWACTDHLQVALLQSSTGKVYVFDALPTSGGGASGSLLGTFATDAHLESRKQEDCVHLYLVSSDGTASVLQ